MTWRRYALLGALGLALAAGVAAFQHFPGYLDSDYYFAGGKQLAAGRGFSEPYLWNYLDDPAGLPHPSHTYWMPLSSIIAAAGLWLTRSSSYAAGRLGFQVLAGIVPIITAALAYDFTRRANLAMASGLLGVFTVYYAPFLPVTDNYGPYIVLGAAFFLLLRRRGPVAYLLLGVVSGLMMLARSDGLMWLALLMLVVGWRAWRERQTRAGLGYALLALAGFLLAAGPWLWRTHTLFGTWMAPGGSHLLWLKSYDETFLYPASGLSMQAWLAQGWGPILSARLVALRWNLLNAFAAQGEIFLLPFILVGAWSCRCEQTVQVAGIGWLGLLLVMTLAFPFAGFRGGFFHSGATLQPMWWTLAPLGLDRVVAAARRRGLFTPAAFTVFQGALVALAVLMTGLILWIRVLPGWGEGEQTYPKVEAFLLGHGMQADDRVIVRNPPGYYIMTGRSAVVVPYGDEAVMAAVAERYVADYLVIEPAGAAGPIEAVYQNTSSTTFRYLGEIDGTRIFHFEP